MGKINVAIIGVGKLRPHPWYREFTSTWRSHPTTQFSGLMHNTIGSYRIEDIEVVAAFDIDENKVGKDLSEAIFTDPKQHVEVRRRTDNRRQG